MTGTQRPGAAPVTVHWAVLGKYPGRPMGYEILGTSLDPDRAGRYLWGAQTGTPDVRHPEETGGLPWRIFLSGVEGERTAACAMVEQDWDRSSRDGTGAPIITSRLLLLEWPQAAGAGVSWSGLASAAAGVRWPQPGDPPTGPPLQLGLHPASATELAAVIEDVGFDWAACVAALLTDGHHVTLTGESRNLPGPERRVRIVDAIAALLPYGCRSWLSAANWTGEAEHWVQLTFAETARTGRTAVRYGHPATPPTGHGAAAYLAELKRLRAKGLTTADLIRHLLAATTPLRRGDGPEMLRALRELDLAEAVLAEVREGRGRIEDVARALGLGGAARLEPEHRRELFLFLARAAAPVGKTPRDERAVDLLHAHRAPELPGWLARAVLADAAHGFERCFAWLDLLRELYGPGSAEFASMFTTVIDPSGPAPAAVSHSAWIATVVQRAQKAYRAEAEPAAHVLVRYPELGRAWAHTTIGHGGPDPDVLVHLLHAAEGERLRTTTGWLRFTAYLCGILDEQGLMGPNDAADFARGLPATLWPAILELAVRHHRPLTLLHLWGPYWEVALGPRGQELATLLARYAESLEEDAGSSRAVCAADLDLLRLAASDHEVPLGGLERLLAREPVQPVPRTGALGRDAGWAGRYAGRLADRLSNAASDLLWQRVVEQVLGNWPDPARSPVLRRLVERQARGEEAVVKALDKRLLTGDAAWFDLDLPPAVVTALEQRPGSRWIVLLTRIRHAARGPADPDVLAAALVEAHHGRFPVDLTAEVVPALGGWSARQVDRLAAELWRQAQPLAEQLYQGMLHTTAAARLRVGLLDHGHQELRRLEYAQEVLAYDGYRPKDPPAGPPPQPSRPPTDRRGLLPWRFRR
ncbi:hypothetical protein ACFYUY_08000 [Kitasatospora sp. NPDC004745]|uniref:hypothetical protein n=1 Tax=Kitasatospora sp. NPDC004745 TaxID=3364019 RepID=UPI0036A05563